jgi:hypothetical protein
VINEILIDMNSRIPVRGILCDLEKAFDCVDLGIKVDKLEFIGIIGKILTIIELYLSGTYQNYPLTNSMHMIIFLLEGKKV